jgi:uncharacterized protein YigE (DUF2233 family)
MSSRSAFSVDLPHRLAPVRTLLAFALIFCSAPVLAQNWEPVGPGVDYARITPRPPIVYHVTRVDLREEKIRVLVTPESDRATRVSEFADRHDALVAVNGDYFDEQLRPIGLTVGACGRWKSRGAATARKEIVLAIGRNRATLVAEGTELPSWADHALSGWPALVRDCSALSAKQLPGSDRFTRAPHYRTAAGVTKDGRTLFLVLAAGKKDGSAGVTLAELGAFMKETLDVCSAVNLDGGGSAVMAVNEKLVEAPSYGEERRVGNHLAVVRAEDYPACESAPETKRASLTDAEVWGEIEETVGRKGLPKEGSSYWLDLGQKSGSWVMLRRGDDGRIRLTGSLRVPVGAEERISQAIVRHGLTVKARRRVDNEVELQLRAPRPLTVHDAAVALRGLNASITAR